MCHLDDVGAPVTEVEREPVQRVSTWDEAPNSLDVNRRDRSKKKSRMINIFAASVASTSESNMWNKLQEMISSGAGNGRK